MTVSEQTFQMLWDCKYCGQRKNLGLTHRFCGSCGAPQDAAARYFPPEGEEVAVNDHVFVGADVHCAGCNHWNSRAAKCCTNCGAPIGGQAAPLRPEMASAQQAMAMPAHPMPAQTSPKKPNKALAIFLVALVMLLTGAIGLFCVAVFWTREGVVEVTGHSWSRTIEVEKLATVRDSAWCDSLPTGARTYSRHDETRSTEKIPDGETCTTRKKDQGDGTFKQIKECTPKYKEKPIKAPKCDYEIERWISGRTIEAHGNSLTETPTWPTGNIRSGACIGCEREGKRTEKYTVAFVEPKTKKALSCDVPIDRWSQLKAGSKWKGEIGQMTGLLDCSSLKP